MIDLSETQQIPRILGTDMLYDDEIREQQKLQHEYSHVLSRLRLDNINDDFVRECARSLMDTCAGDVAQLKESVATAENAIVEDLEEGMYTAKLAERQMHDPLIRLFRHIKYRFKHSSNTESTQKRAFRRTHGALTASEPHLPGISRACPNLIVAPIDTEVLISRDWTHRDAFGEITSTRSRGRKTTSDHAPIPEIIAKRADYARLFLGTRPFILFCVGILVFGTEFCVGIFDRDGVTFSRIHYMFNDPEVFVRVVYSIIHNLSIQELGFDPTVKVLSVSYTQTLTGQKEVVHPSALISRAGNNSRQWCTIGPPIWTSLSLLGGATTVWRVREYFDCILSGKDMISKTAWRSSSRIAESDIYQSLQRPIEGLAEFECGGEVELFHPDGYYYPLTMRNLRNETHGHLHDISTESGNPTPVLRRLVLRTIGRPMWEYQSELELLCGFHDALLAHEQLVEAGVLHRNISAGNVLLSADQNATVQGFMTDMDCARISTHSSASELNTANRTEDLHRGEHVSGITQFIARELLSHPETYHEPRHDVESFIWVLSYSVLRKLWYQTCKSDDEKIDNQRPAFSSIYQAAFGRRDIASIRGSRLGNGYALQFADDGKTDKIIGAFMSDTMIWLFDGSNDLVLDAQSRKRTIHLHHEAVIGLLNQAVLKLEWS